MERIDIEELKRLEGNEFIWSSIGELLVKVDDVVRWINEHNEEHEAMCKAALDAVDGK